MSTYAETVEGRVARTIAERGLAGLETPVLLMVSGGSDSTAMAYLMADLREAGQLGPLAMLHVNHQIRGEASDADAAFARDLASALTIPFFEVEVDVPLLAKQSHQNLEAVARSERYAAADEALQSLCLHSGAPLQDGRIFVAHTQDDRVENFYMRSIVGTGPGGFRSMRYSNGKVMRPCLDVSREDLRDYLRRRAMDAQAQPSIVLVRDGEGHLWREDATNAHTDRFRSFVRHEIIPLAESRNPQLRDTLCRTMNLIADEDDMLAAQATGIVKECVTWAEYEGEVPDESAGCLIEPQFGEKPLPLQRRAANAVLERILGENARVEAASVQAVTDAFEGGQPRSGYTANIQGDLALSCNKQGLRIEPMVVYRARRKKL